MGHRIQLCPDHKRDQTETRPYYNPDDRTARPFAHTVKSYPPVRLYVLLQMSCRKKNRWHPLYDSCLLAQQKIPCAPPKSHMHSKLHASSNGDLCGNKYILRYAHLKHHLPKYADFLGFSHWQVQKNAAHRIVPHTSEVYLRARCFLQAQTLPRHSDIPAEILLSALHALRSWPSQNPVPCTAPADNHLPQNIPHSHLYIQACGKALSAESPDVPFLETARSDILHICAGICRALLSF